MSILNPMEFKHQMPCIKCKGRLVMRNGLYLCEDCEPSDSAIRNMSKDWANRIDVEIMNDVIPGKINK